MRWILWSDNRYLCVCRISDYLFAAYMKNSLIFLRNTPLKASLKTHNITAHWEISLSLFTFNTFHPQNSIPFLYLYNCHMSIFFRRCDNYMPRDIILLNLLILPKIYEYFGLIFYFWSNEHEPIHVHVTKGGRGKIWIQLQWHRQNM